MSRPRFLTVSFPLFAVPGPADSVASRGCHRLIRDGTRLVETVDDILKELGPLDQEVRTAPEERHQSAIRPSWHFPTWNGRSWATWTIIRLLSMT